MAFPRSQSFAQSAEDLVIAQRFGFSLCWLEDATDYAAFGADRGAINGYGLRAGYKGDYGGNFLRCFEPLHNDVGLAD